MKNMKMKTIFIGWIFFMIANVSLMADTDHPSLEDYSQTTTAEMLRKDQETLYKDFQTWINPTFENKEKHAHFLFGSKNNAKKFLSYVTYAFCMLTAIHPDREVVDKTMKKCEQHALNYPIVDITHILQKVRENSDKREDMKDLAEAVLRTYDFFMKYRKILPAIDDEMPVSLSHDDLL